MVTTATRFRMLPSAAFLDGARNHPFISKQSRSLPTAGSVVDLAHDFTMTGDSQTPS